jgi:hypothetical protein
LTLSLERGGAREQYDLDWVPEASPLQFQITSLEGPLPKHNLDPQSTMEADGGKLTILFGEAPNQLLALQVNTTMTRRLNVTMAPYVKFGAKSAKFNLKEVQQAAALATAQYQEMNNLVTAKIGPEEIRKQRELLLPQQQALAIGYADLFQKALELKDSGKVHFRAFFLAGQRQVEVLKTGQAAPAEAADEKPQEERGRDARAK